MNRLAQRQAYQLLLDGAKALSEVEAAGIKIDVDYLHRTIVSVQAEIDQLRAELKNDKVWTVWKRRFGDRAKIGSTEQLAAVLFDELKLPYPSKERTATGKYKTDESVIEKVDLPFCKTYIHLKKLYKTKTTYLEGILREVRDGFLHPFFLLHLADSYRSSSSSPNFQNIPIRNKEMKKLIRQAFVPRGKKRRIVSCDYSGIEVKVAYLHHLDPTMRKYLLDKTTDMHRDMAAQIYMLKNEQVADEARHAAKNLFVFPQFYGSVYFQCAPALWESLTRHEIRIKKEEVYVKDHLRKKGIKELGDCDAEATSRPGTFVHHVQQVEKDFWGNRFKVYNQWKRDWYNQYLERGWFQSLTGFVYHTVLRRNQVLNYAIQGEAFHCLLKSVIYAVKEIRKRRMKSLVIGQIHDDALGDVPDDELQDYLGMMTEIMTQWVPRDWKWITIPLEIGTEVTPPGASWFEKAKWVCKNGVWQQKED
jgi:DNA polymerase I-like protein with 3'-5' exonuclease and polymerase domains